MGASYEVYGAGDGSVEDIDICVYDQSGQVVGCDQLVDRIPIVEFTAESSGTYRAVLNAYAISWNSAHAGMNGVAGQLSPPGRSIAV